MNKDFFINQLEKIISDFYILQQDYQNENFIEYKAINTKAKAAVERITGPNSEYYKDVVYTLEKGNYGDSTKTSVLISIVSALKDDLQNCYLKSLSEIIHSEVFSDYLDMADHLLSEGYKDPAAVLIGSTLENNLRELCKKNNIEIEFLNTKNIPSPKKAEVLNTDLAKANIYSVTQQKQVTAWLGIRNSAAHGKYEEYSLEEVKLFLLGVRQFIIFFNN